jgi:hypothetical protein
MVDGNSIGVQVERKIDFSLFFNHVHSKFCLFWPPYTLWKKLNEWTAFWNHRWLFLKENDFEGMKEQQSLPWFLV